MLCPFCGYESSKVLESRSNAEKSSIRRRRECENCQKRFTTYEKIEFTPLVVIKKSGQREDYSREKLCNSLVKACSKCDIDFVMVERIADSIELELSILGRKEINTFYLGEKVLESLKMMNDIAYIRYLTGFKGLKTADELMQELRSMTRQMSLI